MDNWMKISQAINILNVSESFLRRIICREEFVGLVSFKYPILINYNKDFIKLIKKYIKRQNIIKENIKNFKLYKKNEINKNTSKKWTKSAIDCYAIRCDCNKCCIKDIIDFDCQMKKTVLELVKKFGPPKIDRSDIL